MPFLNRIRLPLYLKNAQFPTEANRFRLSNGTTKTLSVTIKKSYEAVTDYLSDGLHQKLVVALNHDTVNIEGDRYIGGVSVDGEYEIAAVDFLDYPLRQASVKLQVTPFDFTNDNCQTCEQASQLALVDDNAGEIADGEAKEVDVFANDNICCFPVTAEIVSFASGYLDSATIDAATGIATLTAKDPATSVGNMILATYRVTCPDGSYDEADIYGSIAGSSGACEQPTDIIVTLSDPPAPFTMDASWTPPGTPPPLYEWILQSEGLTYGTGNNSAPEIFGSVTDLPGSTTFTLSVRSVCSDGVYSPYTVFEFSTPDSGSDSCEAFLVTADDGTVDPNTYNYSYMDCLGNIQSFLIFNLATHRRCMITSFGLPIYFEGDPPISIVNDGPC